MSTKRIVILDSSESTVLKSGVNDLKNLNLVKLKHPKSNDFNHFLLAETNEQEYDLFELLNYNADMGSIFIDNYVQSECLVFLASRFDFNYFLISMLFNQTSDSFLSLKELKQKLLELNSIEKESKEASILINDYKWSEDVKSLEKLFDLDLENKETIKLKFNQVKCIKWLRERFELLKTYLMAFDRVEIKTGVNIKSKTKQEEKGVFEKRLTYEAFELICQYIDKSLAEKFRKELNLTNPLDDNGNTNSSKRAKAQESIKIE